MVHRPATQHQTAVVPLCAIHRPRDRPHPRRPNATTRRLGSRLCRRRLRRCVWRAQCRSYGVSSRRGMCAEYSGPHWRQARPARRVSSASAGHQSHLGIGERNSYTSLALTLTLVSVLPRTRPSARSTASTMCAPRASAMMTWTFI